eukprot:6486829-Amphidinium_carterae.2
MGMHLGVWKVVLAVVTQCSGMCLSPAKSGALWHLVRDILKATQAQQRAPKSAQSIDRSVLRVRERLGIAV